MVTPRNSIPPGYLAPVFLGETSLPVWNEILRVANALPASALTTDDALRQHLQRHASSPKLQDPRRPGQTPPPLAGSKSPTIATGWVMITRRRDAWQVGRRIL
jgi:hypothetical protein